MHIQRGQFIMLIMLGTTVIVGNRIITKLLAADKESTPYEEISCGFPIEINVRLQ